MSSGMDNLMLLGWLSTATARPSLVVPVLPPFIDAITTFFRFMALLTLLPIVILALVDILGWLFFKLVLRPLGYASTIRFKDPEPNVYIQHFLAVKHFARRRKPRTKSVPAATAEQPASATTAAAKSLSRSRSRSRSKNKLTEDEVAAIPIEVIPPPAEDESSSASDSSTTSSPILSYSTLSADPAHSTPATSAEQSPDSAPPSPDLDGSNALGLSPDLGGHSAKLAASSANSSSSSLVSLGMTRQRAGSVGVDGPLVEIEETASSEDDAVEGGVPSGETSEDEARSSGLRRRKLPKGGPAFGFTDMAT